LAASFVLGLAPGLLIHRGRMIAPFSPDGKGEGLSAGEQLTAGSFAPLPRRAFNVLLTSQPEADDTSNRRKAKDAGCPDRKQPGQALPQR
jgi:hypothetical protein